MSSQMIDNYETSWYRGIFEYRDHFEYKCIVKNSVDEGMGVLLDEGHFVILVYSIAGPDYCSWQLNVDAVHAVSVAHHVFVSIPCTSVKFKIRLRNFNLVVQKKTLECE